MSKKRKFAQFNKPIPEPPEGASATELLRVARNYWSRRGTYPEWYYRRKKLLDKPKET